MSNLGLNSSFGDFTIFGFTRDPGFIKERLSVQLGITPQTIEIGSLGQLFYYTSYGDVAESEEEIVIKLGFLRTITKSALNAQQLLEHKLVKSEAIDTGTFSGNGLVVGISKTKPVFSIFQTLMCVPQIYYSLSDDSIICSDVLRCITNLLSPCYLNEAILPQHFLFGSIYGSTTYFQNVERLIPGQYFKWTEKNVETRFVRSLDTVSEEVQYIRDDVKAMNLLYEALQDVVGDYITQIEVDEQRLATLLSGGVDSTLIQHIINTNSFQRPLRSISYAIQVPSFEFESDYALQASQLLHTEHTFVNYTPQDYPDLLIRTVDILSKPPSLQTEPSMLAITEFIRAANWLEKYFFTGLAADSLFGIQETPKLKGLQLIRRIPFIVPLLRGLGKAFAPLTDRGYTLLKGADMLSSDSDPDAYASPSNLLHVYIYNTDWEVMRHSFSDQELREALAFRRNLAAQYSSSNHYLEKIHYIDLFSDTYEIMLQRQQLFLAHQIIQVDPFSDEDILKVAFTFHPNMRYIKGFRHKHLLKRLLAQKTKAPVANQRKGGSTTPEDLIAWMRSGSLQPLVKDITRPPFMSQADFEGVKKRSNYFLWNLLTFDIFYKRILDNQLKP